MSQRLSELLTPTSEPKAPFMATIVLASGALEFGATVTALLQRTVVWHNGDPTDRHLARLDRVLVESERLDWRAPDGSRSSENGQPDYREESRSRGRHAGHMHQRSKRLQEAMQRDAELAAKGQEWCTRAKHAVPMGEVNKNGWCRPCNQAYQRSRQAYNTKYQREQRIKLRNAS